MADGGEALLLGVDAALDQLLLGVAEDVVVDARFVAALAAQQLVARARQSTCPAMSHRAMSMALSPP